MRIISPYYRIETDVDGDAVLRKLERAARTCYKSEGQIGPGSAEKLVAMVLERGHESVIEHESVSVRFVCDRGVSHEIVRHRLASYSQESTRYCNYSRKKFGNEITVIDLRPFLQNTAEREIWTTAMELAEGKYFAMLEAGASPQIARSVLPNSLKTELVMTANLREWRHFFRLRAAPPAHPQMRQLACPLLAEFRQLIPVIFDDVGDPDCG